MKLRDIHFMAGHDTGKVVIRIAVINNSHIVFPLIPPQIPEKYILCRSRIYLETSVAVSSLYHYAAVLQLVVTTSNMSAALP